ncbi:MAG: ABC transporter permease, partial [Bdellovibrionales bacterium]
SKTSTEILRLLRELNAKGKTVVIITHDPEVAEACDRVIWIRDGKVQSGDGAVSAAPMLAGGGKSLPKLKRLDWWTLLRESGPRAWQNLQRNKMRSLLTMLGVVVGVASILAMLTLGTFTKEKILQSYATLGINTLVFQANPNWSMKAVDQPANIFSALNLMRDVWPLKTVFPEINKLSPSYASYNHSAIYGGRSLENEVSVLGVSDDFFGITRREMAIGSPIRDFHVRNQSSVCVIGFELAQRLFQRQKPLGESIQVVIDEQTFSCVVIGVAKPTFSKDTRRDPDKQVILPYTYFDSLPFYWYYHQLRSLMMEVDPNQDIEMTGKKIQGFFEKRYSKSGIFRASSDSVLVAQMKRFLNLFTLLLVSIAALSLIVGGMGITNMMLVSVNERFREIGLRKAMGASDSAIRQLFFAESLLLCGGAGLIGVAIGFFSYEGLIYLGSKVISDLKFEWVFNPMAFLISFVAILITGVLSGLGPALRAEKLQVIEALRSE